MAKQNLKYFWLLLVVLCTTTHVAFATTVERMFTESLSDDGASVNQLVVDGSFTNVGNDCTPDQGTGWTIYELRDGIPTTVEKGSTTAFGQRARMFTYSCVPNLPVAYWNRNLFLGSIDIDKLKNSYYMTYGEEADPANEPPLILEKARYNFSWYCINWKGDNNMYYFDIINEAGEVVYHREDLITATLNGNRSSEAEATKIEFVWSPEKEGKYILKWYMQGESSLGNIKVEKVRKRGSGELIEYFALNMEGLGANALPLGVTGYGDDSYRIGDGVSQYVGAPRIMGGNDNPNQGIYWCQRGGGANPGSVEFGKAYIDTMDDQYPAINLEPGSYVLTYKNAGWNGSSTGKYNVAIKNELGEPIYEATELSNSEVVASGPDASVAITTSTIEFDVKEAGNYYIEFTTTSGWEAQILTALAITNNILDNEIASGTCGKNGDNITWVLDDDGTLSLSGSGEMKEYGYFYDVPWYSNREKVKKVSIVDGITSIGDHAFSFCSGLTSIIIPNSVTNIGVGAFNTCM